MEDFSSISLLSLAMLVGCYVAGTIPLAVNFSEVSQELDTFLCYSCENDFVWSLKSLGNSIHFAP